MQSIVDLGNSKQAESDLSAEASVVPRDIFPPVAPKGVQASNAPNSIELSWERNTEEDLNGYRVYRAEGNGALEKIADVSVVPSYSDRKVEHGKTYRYAITAVEQPGKHRAPSGTGERGGKAQTWAQKRLLRGWIKRNFLFYITLIFVVVTVVIC